MSCQICTRICVWDVVFMDENCAPRRGRRAPHKPAVFRPIMAGTSPIVATTEEFLLKFAGIRDLPKRKRTCRHWL